MPPVGPGVQLPNMPVMPNMNNMPMNQHMPMMGGPNGVNPMPMNKLNNPMPIMNPNAQMPYQRNNSSNNNKIGNTYM